eukprot:g9725.t1
MKALDLSSQPPLTQEVHFTRLRFGMADDLESKLYEGFIVSILTLVSSPSSVLCRRDTPLPKGRGWIGYKSF